MIGAYLGEGRVPPWLNEGAAMLVESPAEHEKQYWPLLRQFAKDIVPIAELIAMPHPATAGQVVRSSGPTATVTQMGSVKNTLFYPESFALLSFIAEKEGLPFVGRMAQQMARGKTFAETLQDAKQLPKTIEGLQPDWHRWLQSHRVRFPTG